VGFEFDGMYFWMGSHNQEIFPKTRRYRNITSGNARVSIVIDDVASVNPWRPRGIKVSGKAEVTKHNGIFEVLSDQTCGICQLGDRAG